MIMSDGIAWGSKKRYRDPIERAGQISFSTPAIRVPNYDATKMTQTSSVVIPKTDPVLRNKIIDTMPVRFTTLQGIDSFIDRQLLLAPQGLQEPAIIAWIQDKITDRYNSVTSDAFSDKGLLASSTVPPGVPSREQARDALDDFRVQVGAKGLSRLDEKNALYKKMEAKLTDFISNNYLLLHSGTLSRERVLFQKIRDLADEAAMTDANIYKTDVETQAAEKAQQQAKIDAQKDIESKALQRSLSSPLVRTLSTPKPDVLKKYQNLFNKANLMMSEFPDEELYQDMAEIANRAYMSIRDAGVDPIPERIVEQVENEYIIELQEAKDRDAARQAAVSAVAAKAAKKKTAMRSLTAAMKTRSSTAAAAAPVPAPGPAPTPSPGPPTRPITPVAPIPPTISPELDRKLREIEFKAALSTVGAPVPLFTITNDSEIKWARKLDNQDAKNLKRVFIKFFPEGTTLDAPSGDIIWTASAAYERGGTSQTDIIQFFDTGFSPFNISAWYAKLP